ncbi:MAG: PAS domain S-box protein [Fibrobacter sp.]|nr:PAS domain S-box protein [Fibrobacter sp.]
MLSQECILICIVLFVVSFFLNRIIILRQIKKQSQNIVISDLRYKTIFNTIPEPIIITEIPSGKIVSFNPPASKLFNLKNDIHIFDIFYNTNIDIKIDTPLSTKKLNGTFNAKINSNLIFAITSIEIFVYGKDCILSFIRDITGDKKNEKALGESIQRYRELTDILPEAVFETGPDGFITYANPKAYELFGYTPNDLNRISPMEMVVESERKLVKENMQKVFTRDTRQYHEYTGLHSSGKQFPILAHATAIVRDNKAVGICGIAIDLTERIRIEKELQKNENIEALGTLSGGIAHDFNNLLTGLLSGLSVLKLNYNDYNNNKCIIDDMEQTVLRGKNLTGRLLTYSKGGAPIKETTTLDSLVKETTSYILSGKQTEYEIDIENNIFPVDIDSTQIIRVIQNLLINAVEAMSGTNGKIKITLKNKLEPNDSGSGDKKFVELIITDSGIGIPQNLHNRIFHPFFTTKSNCSGLGLPTSCSIIEKHNGKIYFETAVGKGTSFHVILPASSKDACKKPHVVECPGKKAKGRVLLMDDEKIILTVTQKLLEHLGYSVVLATNSEMAINSYKKSLEDNNKFNIVILDLTIPSGAGGKEVLAELIKIDPEVTAVVSSGYSHDPIMANYLDHGFKGFIRKPYSLDELSECLTKVMNTVSATDV